MAAWWMVILFLLYRRRHLLHLSSVSPTRTSTRISCFLFAYRFSLARVSTIPSIILERRRGLLQAVMGIVEGSREQGTRQDGNHILEDG